MNVKSELLATLANAGGDYISGAALADKLGVSRNAVWKAVKSLEADGFSISSVTSKGYKLNEDNNKLSADLITPYLTTKEMGYCGFPLAGASLPVFSVFLLGVYSRNVFLIAAAVILGIGHIGIHSMHKKEI